MLLKHRLQGLVSEWMIMLRDAYSKPSIHLKSQLFNTVFMMDSQDVLHLHLLPTKKQYLLLDQLKQGMPAVKMSSFSNAF